MFADCQWLNEPTEETHGAFTFTIADDHFTFAPPGKKDFWRKTFYTPELIKDDGCALLKPIPLGQGDVTISVKMVLKVLHQFDQGGLLIRVDSEH